jgi:hypothetical protein
MLQPFSVCFAHLRLVTMLLAALCSVPAYAQGTTKIGASQISGELQLLTSFQTLERAATGMDRFLTYGIVSSGGGWGVLEFVDTTSFASNSSVLKKSAIDYHLEVIRANAAIQRSKFAVDADKRRSEDIAASLYHLFDAVPAIADALKRKDIATASQAYRDHGQGAYETALRNAQSAVSSMQSRLQKTIRSQQKLVIEQLTVNDGAVKQTLILQQSRLMKKYHDFDRQTRHFHYVLVNAILSSYGGWRNLPENYNATQAGLIDGVIDKMSAATNRMKARANGFGGITEQEAAELIGSVTRFQELFEIGINIRDLLYAEDFDAANLTYYNEALPLFESIWNSNYTLISEARSRLPKR